MLKVLKSLPKKPFVKKSLADIPEAPGVYIYWSNSEKINYVGKAINLKNRISSYFLKNLGTKTEKLTENTKNFSIIEVGSEIEALLLEAKLINNLKPSYNAALKDDKKPLYIRITDEPYPRVLTARKKDEKPTTLKSNLLFIGPFPSSNAVKGVLSMLRKIIPYSQHEIGKRGCLYSQMGLCDPCPNEIEKQKNKKTKKVKRDEYLGNIRLLKGVLTSRFTFVRRSLEKKMTKLAKLEKFEEAAVTRNQIRKLDYITQPVTPINYFLENPNLKDDIRSKEAEQLHNILGKYIKLPEKLTRIECYDVAHLAGVNATGSMVTFINGEPDKSLYRHFRINQTKGQSDTDSMYELGERRAKNLRRWGGPDLIIVDGGKAQVGVFRKVFNKLNITVVGIAKKEEKLVIPIKLYNLKTYTFIERKLPYGPAKNLVQRLRNEAHRFARRYHHKLLQKELIPQI